MRLGSQTWSQGQSLLAAQVEYEGKERNGGGGRFSILKSYLASLFTRIEQILSDLFISL